MSRRFEDNPDNDPIKQEAYKVSLSKMSDEELYDETGRKIWLSAYANNNPISCYHWQLDATYDEWVKRQKTEMYIKAHKKQLRNLS